MDGFLTSASIMATTVEARLQYLETREGANTREVLKLKHENVDLKTKIHDLAVGYSQAQRNIDEMDTRYRKMESDLTTVYNFGRSLEDRLKELEFAMKSVKGNDDRLHMMETRINKARQDLNSFTQSMTEKLEAFDKNGNISNSVLKRTTDNADRVSKLETGISITRERLNSFAHLVTERYGEHVPNSQSEELDGRIKALEDINVLHTDSVVDVKLKSRQRMETNVAMAMDHCEEVARNGGWFNVSSCSLVPHAHGDFLICVVFVQAGQGQIAMSARIAGRENPLHFGNLSRNGSPLSSCLRVVTLRKGQKLWLEAVRTEGKSFVHWCRLYCRLL